MGDARLLACPTSEHPDAELARRVLPDQDHSCRASLGKQFAAAQAQIPPPAHPGRRAGGAEGLATLVGGGLSLTLGHDHSLSAIPPVTES
jgi:hypothetical protein